MGSSFSIFKPPTLDELTEEANNWKSGEIPPFLVAVPVLNGAAVGLAVLDKKYLKTDIGGYFVLGSVVITGVWYVIKGFENSSIGKAAAEAAKDAGEVVDGIKNFDKDDYNFPKTTNEQDAWIIQQNVKYHGKNGTLDTTGLEAIQAELSQAVKLGLNDNTWAGGDTNTGLELENCEKWIQIFGHNDALSCFNYEKNTGISIEDQLQADELAKNTDATTRDISDLEWNEAVDQGWKGDRNTYQLGMQEYYRVTKMFSVDHSKFNPNKYLQYIKTSAGIQVWRFYFDKKTYNAQYG
jgi:hypothetical protein